MDAKKIFSLVVILGRVNFNVSGYSLAFSMISFTDRPSSSTVPVTGMPLSVTNTWPTGGEIEENRLFVSDFFLYQ